MTKIVLTISLLLVSAPMTLAQKDTVVDDVWRGRVEAVNSGTREIKISSLANTADSLTGVLDAGSPIKLLDDSVKELDLSEIPLGMRIMVFYKTKNERVAGEKRKINHIYGIVFLGRDDFDKLRAFLNLPSSTKVLGRNISLPLSNPIKLFIFYEPPRSKKDLVAWVAKWNRERATTDGEIELVDDFAHSEVSIVVYNAVTEMGELAKINPEAPVMWPSATVFFVMRTADGLSVLWKYSPIFSSPNGSGPSERIKKELENRMKTRGHP